MAKTEIYGGYNGNVTFGTGIKAGIDVTGFTCAHTIEEVVVPPAFGEKYAKSRPGAARLTGTLRGTLVQGASGNKPFDPTDQSGGATVDFDNMIGTLTLQAEAGCTIAATCLLHTTSITRNNAGEGTIEIQFSNSEDDVAVTWDES